MRIHAQEYKARLDRAILIKSEQAVLVGIHGLQFLDQRRQIRHQPVQAGHLGQLVPFLEKEHHQVAAQFRVRLGNLVAGQHANRLKRTLDDRQRRIIHPEHNRGHRPPPTCKRKVAAVACEQFLDILWCHQVFQMV